MRITRCINREYLWAFKFIIVESEECYWLILCKINECSYSKVWSFKKLAGENSPKADDLIDIIIALAEPSGNMDNLIPRLELRPITLRPYSPTC